MATDELSQQWWYGHEAGYLDAVSELWAMAHAAFDAGDGDRSKLLHEIAEQVKGRLQHHKDSYPA